MNEFDEQLRKLIQMERHNFAGSSARAIVDVLDATNDIAAIRITMEDWHGQNFVDYHLLQKGADGWKIVAKVFTETK